MSEQRIEPHKVTKPIQLLAAWLVGLVLTNATFLTASIQIGQEGWERGALVGAAISNVPIFLVALFLLQTRFRAELQEDHFYAEYLSKKTSALVRIDKGSSQEGQLDELQKEVARINIALGSKDTSDTISKIESSKEAGSFETLDWAGWAVALNLLHPRFKDIRDALRAAHIPLAEVFGGANSTPKKWIISINRSLPFEHVAQLLRVLLPFDFDGFQLWKPRRDADEKEDVYIGSYGEDRYVEITNELSGLLKEKIEAADLALYSLKNRVPPRQKS